MRYPRLSEPQPVALEPSAPAVNRWFGLHRLLSTSSHLHVKRIVAVLLMTCVTFGLSFAQETDFRGVKVADAKGKQADASLILSDSSKTIVVRVADRDFVTIPYDQVDKFSYEYTKKHRVTQGAIVMVASIGAGAVVMLTKSKSHWLYIDYHDQAAPKTLVLRMDKKEYKKILASVTAHTGKEVHYDGDANKKA